MTKFKHKNRYFVLLNSKDIVEHLKRFGYAIEPNVVPVEECEKMASVLDEIESEQRKAGTISYSNTAQITIDNTHLIRPDIFLNKINIPNVLEVVSEVLGQDFILSSVSASRSGPDGGKNHHTDSRMPIRDFSNTIQLVATLCLDDYTETNGATLVYPFSHNLGENEEVIRAQKNISGKIAAVAPKGSILYFLAQTLHDVGPNIDGKRRWGIIFGYNRWWIKPVYDFTQCGKEIFQKLTPIQKTLFGFTSKTPRYGGKRHYTRINIDELPQDYEQAKNI